MSAIISQDFMAPSFRVVFDRKKSVLIERHHFACPARIINGSERRHTAAPHSVLVCHTRSQRTEEISILGKLALIAAVAAVAATALIAAPADAGGRIHRGNHWRGHGRGHGIAVDGGVMARGLVGAARPLVGFGSAIESQSCVWLGRLVVPGGPFFSGPEKKPGWKIANSRGSSAGITYGLHETEERASPGKKRGRSQKSVPLKCECSMAFHCTTITTEAFCGRQIQRGCSTLARARDSVWFGLGNFGFWNFDLPPSRLHTFEDCKCDEPRTR